MSETRKDDMLICERLGRCPTPIACSNPYECRDAKRAATPPTPDRAAVREALISLIEQSYFGPIETLAIALGVEAKVGQARQYGPALADALLRPAPLPADAERDAREAAWFRWLRDNPQAAAFTAVNVAKWVPAGPDLGATMASGTVVGEMEDAKNPDYRYHIATSSLPADVQEVVERLRRDLPDPSLGIEHWAAKWVSNGDLRTLLAHLQREAR